MYSVKVKGSPVELYQNERETEYTPVLKFIMVPGLQRTWEDPFLGL